MLNKVAHGALVAVFGMLIASEPTRAGSLDGKYRPAGEEYSGWDCKNIGSDGGALAIEGNVIFGVESACTLNNPVNVNGMNAVLYDAQCAGEGYEWSERVMLMETDRGVYNITDKFVAEWQRC